MHEIDASRELGKGPSNEAVVELESPQLPDPSVRDAPPSACERRAHRNIRRQRPVNGAGHDLDVAARARDPGRLFPGDAANPTRTNLVRKALQDAELHSTDQRLCGIDSCDIAPGPRS